MKTIFENVEIGGIQLKNRLIRSATQEGAAKQDGHITSELIDIYKELAVGGVGATITSMIGIDENSRVFPHMVKAYSDNFIVELSELIKVSHEQDCKVIVQLVHCGAKASPDNGNRPIAPSDIVLSVDRTAQEMTKEDIQNVILNFALAAEACKAAGADGVQIHGAHGYLLSQFLSPFFNKRSDEYGGGTANRARIVFEVYDAIRQKVGNNYPVWIKINSADFVDSGLNFDECLWVCKELDKRRINAIEVSGGIGISLESSPTRIVENKIGTFSDYAMSVAENVDATVISVGGYRSPEIIESLLNKSNIQAVSVCRPLICEPDLPNVWRSGDRRKAQCISCNKCFNPANGFGCQVF